VLRANAVDQPRMDVVAYCATSPTPGPSAPFSSPATSLTVCRSLRRGRMRNLIYSNPVSLERFRVTAMAPTPSSLTPNPTPHPGYPFRIQVPSMPAPSRSHRNLLPSTNAALDALEAATKHQV
jgi:hypothetical protein